MDTGHGLYPIYYSMHQFPSTAGNVQHAFFTLPIIFAAISHDVLVTISGAFWWNSCRSEFQQLPGSTRPGPFYETTTNRTFARAVHGIFVLYQDGRGSTHFGGVFLLVAWCTIYYLFLALILHSGSVVKHP
jgi:hypothetical protein